LRICRNFFWGNKYKRDAEIKMPAKLVAPPAGLQGFIGYNSVGFPFFTALVSVGPGWPDFPAWRHPG